MIRALIILFTYVFSPVVLAQSPEEKEAYRFSHISVSDGLSPGSINSFFKDSKGFLWIGTSSGLNRYDGYEVKVFNPRPADTLTIHSKNYSNIFEDPVGNIWAVTSWGTYIFDPTTSNFSSDQFKILQKFGIPLKEVENIKQDSKGNFLFIHSNGGLTRYNPNNEEVEQIDVSKNENSLAISRISDFEENSEGDFWVLYANGILEKLDGNTLKVKAKEDFLNNRFNNDLQEYKLVVDKDDDLWIHLYGEHGMFYYNQGKSEFKHFDKESSQLKLNSNLISDIVVAPNGRIWVATDHGGITVIDKEKAETTYILNQVEIENSLSHNSLTSLYKDYDGIIWIGTFKNGVDYYHENILRFPNYENLISDDKSLPFNDVNVFSEDNEGDLWIGTNGGGLIEYNREKKSYTQYKNLPENSKSISSDIVVSLLQENNHLWIGTYLGGLCRYNGNEFEKLKFKNTDSSSVEVKSVWELYRDSRGILWAGTLQGGLYLLRQDENEFQHINDVYKGTQLQNDGYISAITEDKDGNIWVGGVNGIDVFNPDTQKHTRISSDTEKNSIGSNYIISIYRDSKDLIWIGTEDGLDLFNPTTTCFYNYNENDGLPGTNVLAIIEDNNEDLWLSSSYGLIQFHKDSLVEGSGRLFPDFRVYDNKDGLQGKLFNANALFKTSKGEILAGGLNGYNLFLPDSFNFNQNKPEIVFTSFDLFNQSLKPRQEVNGRVILNKSIDETSNITLKHNENLFSIEFAALDFFQPSKNSYKYKLDGFDLNWQETGSNNRKVTYTNLDPGTYTFLVKASNNDKIWNNNPASLNIEVLPPWYQTYYAYLVYFLVLVMILYLARKRIIEKHRRQFQIEQEKREADYLHKMDLMKIRFFTNISHEFKTPLSLILAIVEKLKTRSLQQATKEQLELVNKNADRLLNLINQVLDLGNIKNESLLATSKANIIKSIEESAKSFESLAEKKDINYKIQLEEKDFFTSFDRDKLDKIIFNLLSNAFKFTPKGGEITIKCLVKNSARTEYKDLNILVKDSGIGISKEDQENIFERFYKVDDPNFKSTSGSGIGLSLVKEYVALYKGEIKVESKQGFGTTFLLQLPLPIIKEEQKVAQEIKNDWKEEVTGLKESDIEENVSSILIIEDDIDFLNYLTREFEQFYDVFVATNGEKGWKKTLSVQPDLIISDWAMREMNGVDLCRKIRRDNRTKHIPFILLTANKQEEKKLFALKTGVSDYITKPFNFESLLSRVKNLIAQRKAFQSAYSKKINIEEKEITIESQEEKFIRRVLNVIEENIGNPEFSVESLSCQLGVSRTFLYNKLVTKMEKSPQELIRDIRLSRGKELLIKSNLTISEIAFEVGFNNPKYFTKNFKKQFHILPSQYRSKVRRNTPR
ncbi:hypothetical protein APR41_01395 [Salegentibacter salinarum]|uniref:histidine kinase n=1 Tax=Salegentibacter salinarum TaxID=447422 RepID=A0A2N0U460_9FLAO|nr:two-component regulator propeller domain-containing protein [Salegentibacter salinarum]PKD21668.1 hypothetical protein APR41_01395 [Salegentibacter salinarum]SKB35157.1 Signal transduction histidine kinase [Salegentibacter salinarum]